VSREDNSHFQQRQSGKSSTVSAGDKSPNSSRISDPTNKAAAVKKSQAAAGNSPGIPMGAASPASDRFLSKYPDMGFKSGRTLFPNAVISDKNRVKIYTVRPVTKRNQPWKKRLWRSRCANGLSQPSQVISQKHTSKHGLQLNF